VSLIFRSLWTGGYFNTKIVIGMKKPLFYIVLTLAFALPLAAQDGRFVPYVSQIWAEPRNNLIRLTWVDSPDAFGPVYIFRSTRPFSGIIPANIRPVVVRYGEQYYVDDAEDVENIYYFIAASDISGQRYDIVLPQVNSINVNVNDPPVPRTAEAVEAPPAVIEPSEPVQGISNLRASREGDSVFITFYSSFPYRNIVLYRSMQPVLQPQDLLGAIIVQSEITSPFIDFPVPGINWYYTVIYEDDISGGSIGINPGLNATVSAVVIPSNEAVQMALRPIPLPVMMLRDAMPESFFLSDFSRYTPLSEDSARMLAGSVPPREPLTLMNPRVFVVDLESPSSGEESALFQIVKEYFGKLDWEGARVGLLHYLSLPRSMEVESRARFYLGQTLYFTGNYREALFEFLSMKTLHPVEANLWIEATLSALVY